ncbi:hypothetical protein JB92DRAFT_2836168 [Gautieria morchelliformis]|nr:hypothetical protein JB92DRAFT_2836168 [Gautieria morchelliformis]
MCYFRDSSPVIIPAVVDTVPDIQKGIQALSTDPMLPNPIQAMSNAPIIENAIHILDQVSDLGKAMPFVAPAFVLLKFIIEVEKKARDADAKCSDLLERITFMLSHLPALKTVEIIKPTQLVIERMNGILKDAASLIAAYRKQGAVARRLHLNNKDKFIAAVAAINTCSTDIMISLQIHQTTRLDILTRGVPADPEDEAAREFVARHGDLDDFKDNPELVSEFAKQLHLQMDEEVMEQLNTNITDTMQQTMGRLEGMLAGNINSAIVDGLKALAAEMHTSEAQQHFICVQCEKDYTNTSNGPQSCFIHPAAYDSSTRIYPCCGEASKPCQYRSHRSAHHNDYPYAEFFPYVHRILGYMDTVQSWVSVEDTNFEDNTAQEASAGRLLRWASRTNLIEEPTILITVGTFRHDKPCYFHTFTAEDLESVAEAIRLTGKTVIYRTPSKTSEFAMAEWLLSDTNKVSGIRLTAHSATSDSPFIRVCFIDPVTCTTSGDVLTLSEGGFISYKPASPYFLPETVRISPAISDVPLRAPRTNFKTHTSSALRVILKTMSDPPLSANGKALFRLVGDKDYTPVNRVDLLDNAQLPITIEPRQSWRIKFEAVVPRSKEDSNLRLRCSYRALVARDRPLRLKLVLQDIENEECSIVLEYVFNPWTFDTAKDGDLGYFYFDDPLRVDRYYIRVTKPDDTNVIEMNGWRFEQKRLERVVYQAIKSGETEINLEVNEERRDGIWEWNAWALVDLSCRRVYAFKIVMKEGKLVSTKRFGCLGYVLCPSYGDTPKVSRPICRAVEKVKLPKLEPYAVPPFPTDDDLDDFVPEPPVPVHPINGTTASASTSGGQLVISEDLERRLTSIDSNLSRLISIDSNLSRIAEALERLADFGRSGNGGGDELAKAFALEDQGTGGSGPMLETLEPWLDPRARRAGDLAAAWSYWTRWRGNEGEPFAGALVLDDPGVDGRGKSLGLSGFGEGVFSKLERLGVGMDEAGWTGVVFGDLIAACLSWKEGVYRMVGIWTLDAGRIEHSTPYIGFSNGVLHLPVAAAWHTNKTMLLSEPTAAQDKLFVLVGDTHATKYAIAFFSSYSCMLNSSLVDLVWKRRFGWGKILYIRYFSLFALTLNTAVHLNNTTGHDLINSVLRLLTPIPSKNGHPCSGIVAPPNPVCHRVIFLNLSLSQAHSFNSPVVSGCTISVTSKVSFFFKAHTHLKYSPNLVLQYKHPALVHSTSYSLGRLFHKSNPFTIQTFILMILTLYRTLRTVRSMGSTQGMPLVAILLRDGLLNFTAVYGTYNEIIDTHPVLLLHVPPSYLSELAIPLETLETRPRAPLTVEVTDPDEILSGMSAK